MGGAAGGAQGDQIGPGGLVDDAVDGDLVEATQWTQLEEVVSGGAGDGQRSAGVIEQIADSHVDIAIGADKLDEVDLPGCARRVVDPFVPRASARRSDRRLGGVVERQTGQPSQRIVGSVHRDNAGLRGLEAVPEIP